MTTEIKGGLLAQGSDSEPIAAGGIAPNSPTAPCRCGRFRLPADTVPGWAWVEAWSAGQRWIHSRRRCVDFNGLPEWKPVGAAAPHAEEGRPDLGNRTAGDPASAMSGVLFAERLLRWVTENAYHTPTDDFATGLGAVWLSFCFDHDLNPFVELEEILDVFPFAEALGTTVPEWAMRPDRGNAPKAPPSPSSPALDPQETK